MVRSVLGFLYLSELYFLDILLLTVSLLRLDINSLLLGRLDLPPHLGHLHLQHPDSVPQQFTVLLDLALDGFELLNGQVIRLQVYHALGVLDTP